MIESGLTRRAVLAGAALMATSPAFAAAPYWTAIAALEKSSGARIGLAAIDTGNGRCMTWRESERFIMCSSFKLSLAAAMLARAEEGQESLDRLVRYQKSDLIGVSPETTKNLATGMTVEELCRAAVIYSDNAAANQLLAAIGGPGTVTQFWRSLGDETSHLDRIEPALNVPDGEKDTTTPLAMLGNIKEILLGNALQPADRQKLLDWTSASTTGALMLRAGMPKDWKVGDKTGRYVQEPYNAAIDLAIVTPPGRKPVLVTAFTMNGRGDDNAHQALLADIGRVVAAWMA